MGTQPSISPRELFPNLLSGMLSKFSSPFAWDSHNKEYLGLKVKFQRDFGVIFNENYILDFTLMSRDAYACHEILCS